MAKVNVRAKENGHDGVVYRHAGETFQVDSKRLKDGSTWFEEVKGAAPDSEDESGQGSDSTE